METRSEIDGWKRALIGAEAMPSSSVWEGVETQLDKGEVKKLRRTVLFYKMLAAASVSIMMLAFGVDYYNRSYTNPSTQQTSDSEVLKSENSSENNALSGPTIQADKQLFVSPNPRASELSQASSLPPETAHDILTENENRLLFSINTIAASLAATTSFGAGNGNERYGRSKSEEFVAMKSPLLKEQPADAPIIVGPKEENEEKREDDKKGAEKFWTSVGVAAGTFNNATPTSAGAPANALSSFSAGQTAASETNSPGYSYSVNVAVGAKVSKRWLIQGGMSYISQMSDYTATAVVAQPTSTTPVLSAASINQFEKQRDKVAMDILTSTPYSVNSEIQLISFPVQAGYMLVDRKIALQLNSGISTDLFMQNTITPEVENLESVTQGRGDDSPYRPVNFSGLVGTEVSYRFSDHYRVSLSPGIRYPFNSIYKSDLGIKSSPLTFDVALRFRYILK